MALDIHLGRWHFQAVPDRALFWPAQRMLLLADLHLGKADTFRQHGIGIPNTVQMHDLQRLHALLGWCQPVQCVVLGDLVHGRTLHPPTVAAWNQIVQAHPTTQFVLIAGNHDRALQPAQLQLHAVRPSMHIDGVWLSHAPLPRASLDPSIGLNLHGHIHAAVTVPGTRSKSPALIYQTPYLCMPAFSAFTAGVVPQGGCQGVWVWSPDGQEILALQTLHPP